MTSKIHLAYGFPAYSFIHASGKLKHDFTKYMSWFVCRCKGVYACSKPALFPSPWQRHPPSLLYFISLTWRIKALHSPSLTWAKSLVFWQHRLTMPTMMTKSRDKLRNYTQAFLSPEKVWAQIQFKMRGAGAQGSKTKPSQSVLKVDSKWCRWVNQAGWEIWDCSDGFRTLQVHFSHNTENKFQTCYAQMLYRANSYLCNEKHCK